MATKLLILIFVVLVSCNNSDTTQKNSYKAIKTDNTLRTKTLYFSDSGYSSILLRRDTVNGFPEIEEISRSQSYHFIRFLEYYTSGMSIRHALINELSIQHSRDAPSDAKDGLIILKAAVPNVNPIQDTSNLYRLDWIDSTSANEVHYRTEFIEAVLHRDGENAVRKLLNYSTGKPIIEFSSQLYGLQEQDSYHRRFIGYLEKPNIAEQHGSFDTIPDLYGVLSYVDPISNKSQFLLIKSQDAGPSSVWRHQYFDGLSLEGVQTKSKYENFAIKSTDVQQWRYSNFKSFNIVLKFKGTENLLLRIPVRNDRIDISNLHSDLFEFQVR